MPKGSARAQTIRYGKLSACDKFRIQLGCVLELNPCCCFNPFKPMGRLCDGQFGYKTELAGCF